MKKSVVLISLLVGICLNYPTLYSKNIKFSFSVDKLNDFNGLQLIENQKQDNIFYERKRVKVLAPPSSSDYFERHGLSFRVNGTIPPSTKELYLIIEHQDDNIGLIEVFYDANVTENPKQPMSSPGYFSGSDAVGYTCLGTGKARRAIFRLNHPAFRHRLQGETDILIAGVASLTRITLTDQVTQKEREKVRAEIPVNLVPKFTLKNPMHLVTTVGISLDMKDVDNSLARMQELCPLMKVLGFNGIETYVGWNYAEAESGCFDWSAYDKIVNKAQEYDLKWFPLLIVGSAYTLPDWYYQSKENIGFKCLEHGKSNPIQTIFCDNQTPHVKRFLHEFGSHYEPMDVLLGVRLGPSGNYGESQYPAGGNWGHKGQQMHIHIGWWAGDEFASAHFQRFLQAKYQKIDSLNQAWEAAFSSFDEIQTFVPQFAETKRQRKDFVDWYIWAMSDWCEKWAIWARDAMPKTEIYQSAGGWGFVESGTDFTDQTKSMKKPSGGIRATNETDSYAQNFYATRMMSSAARFYGVPFGSEPAGFGSARGVVARIYNILVNNGQHLFYYAPNIINNDQGVEKWLELAPLLDQRQEPLIEAAVLYPDTKSKLDDGVFRHLYSFSFNQRVAALRPHLDFDFCSEQMILDGALNQYKVLVFLWSDIVEASALTQINQWVQEGGTVIFLYWPRMPVGTVEDDYRVYNQWLKGETGKGKVLFDRGDREPPHRFADFVRTELLKMTQLHPFTQKMLRVEKPTEVYVSILKDGQLAILNYNDEPVQIKLPEGKMIEVQPYSIKLTP
jgi:hypothetical protein